MTRTYTHVKAKEKEVMEMRAKGKTRKEIGDYLNLTEKQVENLITRYNNNNKRLEAGIVTRRRGRPPKDYKATQHDKDCEIKCLKYEMNRVKMENELLRDFLRHAGRR
ncbi:MAG: LuxR C-terminal-related transcriptional regulator [Defluviitaleaceae bacterium]|nr:LuxR C-terminal-related transcriptional regulator [Defluviitaleaceae bacterium]